MRELTTVPLVERFMRALGPIARQPVSGFFTGGVTAILHGWRDTTIDVDIKLVPDSDEILRAFARLKEELRINIELASPDEFIPELPGWRDRCLFIRQEGRISFFHYDPYAQALAKIERGHGQDVADVSHMLTDGLVERGRLLELFERIEHELYRFPAIDPASFRRAVLEIVRQES